jgi:hypothetical protein
MTHVTYELYRVRQNDFRAYGTYGANLATITHLETHTISKWTETRFYMTHVT